MNALIREAPRLRDLDAELFFDIDKIRDASVLTDVKLPAGSEPNEILHGRLLGQIPRPQVRRRTRRESYLDGIQRGSCRRQDIAEVTRRRSRFILCISRWL
ncbi:hypothetical protein [Paraburkholderia sp. BL27I4N3]|uniref:hypothetical protein n=1 Tax=Paraburkholderia sp. BL27I4N3 TaxID=1938805 RepID=UPI0011C04565|nr:hypothetical protein [Paraburkholderia sp. BL27I4N3]